MSFVQEKKICEKINEQRTNCDDNGHSNCHPCAVIGVGLSILLAVVVD